MKPTVPQMRDLKSGAQGPMHPGKNHDKCSAAWFDRRNIFYAYRFVTSKFLHSNEKTIDNSACAIICSNEKVFARDVDDLFVQHQR
jgi:hypothetical protein